MRESNSLDPDQARLVGPDLGPNSLQRLWADDTSRQIFNKSMYIVCHYPYMGSVL